MSVVNPKTITDTFRDHGISIAISAPVLQIQELALAVSLQNRYRVSATYQGRDHIVLVTVWERRASDIDPDDPWRLVRRLAAVLPRQESDEIQRTTAIEDLHDIVHVLTTLLEEGQPS